jgi:polysaccharide pyruvyl transferase WcaK-like protein
MPDAATQASTRAMRSAGRLRVGLLGGFGIGNFGNDASLEAMLRFMREERPDAELTCICSDPNGLPERFDLPAIPTVIAPRGTMGVLNKLMLRVPGAIASWIYTLSVLGRFDVIVVAGTGVFDDFRDTPLGWPSRTLRWSLASRLCGVRYAYVSVGAGPLVNPVSRWLMKQAAKLAAYRSYRDDDSHRFMKSIGVDHPSDSVLPDLAFLLPHKVETSRAPGPLTIGVGVMTYGGWHESEAGYNAYLDLHERLIRWIEGQGHKVKAIIGQTPADLKAIDALEARLGKKLLTPDERAMSSIHDAMDAIAGTDLVVASRYHVQIAALKMRRPLISLGYGPKNDALMQAVGLDGFIHNVDATDFDALTQQIEAIAADRARYVAIVDERVTAMESALRQALRKLDFLS